MEPSVKHLPLGFPAQVLTSGREREPASGSGLRAVGGARPSPPALPAQANTLSPMNRESAEGMLDTRVPGTGPPPPSSLALWRASGSQPA